MVLVDNKSIASISVRKSTNGSSILVALGLYSLCFSLSLVGVAYNRMLTKRYQRILTPTNQATDDTLSLLRGGNVEEAMGPRICKTKNNDAKDKITWVMFMGDSNMRHTYHWWTTNGGHNKYKFGIKGSSFGMDKTDKGDEYRWADQEILFSEQDNHIVRYSFRFLHGSVSEFVHDTQHWDVARKSAQLPNQWTIRKMKEEQSEAKEADETSAAEGAEDDETEDIWQGRVRPSDFALWATKHKEPIVDNSKVFNTWMDNWEQKTSPDIVILTEGWGGVPRARASEIVRKIVKTNPETLFIWSPLYITNHEIDRYNSYVEAGVFSWTEQNLRVVDLWDMAQSLPDGPFDVQLGKPGAYHAPPGGRYMQDAMSRLWNEVKECINEEPAN